MKKRRVSKKIGLRACSIIMSAILAAGTVPEAAMTVLAAEGPDIVSEEDGEIISCEGSDARFSLYFFARSVLILPFRLLPGITGRFVRGSLITGESTAPIAENAPEPPI